MESYGALLYVWFISLNIMFLRFIHIAVCVSRPFLFNYWVELHWWICRTLFIFLFLNISIEVGFSVIIETLFHHSNSSYWWIVQSSMELKFISTTSNLSSKLHVPDCHGKNFNFPQVFSFSVSFLTSFKCFWDRIWLLKFLWSCP